ncbi:MAG: hypothetical protein ACYS9X_08470 [Planctomycetota bacterium]|jgi:hypothetical protein
MGRVTPVFAAAVMSGCAVVVVDPAPAPRPAVVRSIHARPARAVPVARRAAVSKQAVIAKAAGLQTKANALAARIERKRVRGRVRMTAKEIAAARREAEELKREAGILAEMRRDATLSAVELQNAMQMEARAMQTISNALKAAHEASKGTVRNVR